MVRHFSFGCDSANLLLITIMITLLCACAEPLHVEQSKCMRFRTVKQIPVVEGKINGKRALFIVDTGASVSILDESLSKRFGFRYVRAPTSQRVLGLGGHASMKLAFNCDVEFAGIRISGIRFHSQHLGEFARAIREHENIEIAGIIGGNVIERYGITINYKNCTISF